VNEVIDLLISIDKYSRKNFAQKIEENYKDKKKFEVEIKYFTNLFKNSDEQLKPKFEFFFGPYLENNE
jgi:hypothetical protein